MMGGFRPACAKLTEEDVRLIRAASEEFERLHQLVDELKAQARELSPTRLAEKFEVSRHTINKCVRRDTWIDIP
jgi:hypothetical protein